MIRIGKRDTQEPIGRPACLPYPVLSSIDRSENCPAFTDSRPSVCISKRNDTPQRNRVVPLIWLTQLAPPSIVLRIIPYQLTAVPLFASVKETALRLLVVPLVWLTQLAPPSIVLRMIPFSPTAVPWLVSVKDTPKSALAVPLVWLPQVVPASVVLRSSHPHQQRCRCLHRQ